MENTTFVFGLGFMLTLIAAVCAAHVAASRRHGGVVVAGWFLVNLCLPLIGLVALDLLTDEHA